MLSEEGLSRILGIKNEFFVFARLNINPPEKAGAVPNGSSSLRHIMAQGAVFEKIKLC